MGRLTEASILGLHHLIWYLKSLVGVYSLITISHLQTTINTARSKHSLTHTHQQHFSIAYDNSSCSFKRSGRILGLSIVYLLKGGEEITLKLYKYL